MNEENTDGAVAPCVTILIPARNAIATIKRAIDSAANQTYPNIYINVLDDGSTDGTGQFVIEMQNTNYAGKIKHIILRNHIMRGAARNQLVTSCNTELACWLDADDMMEPTKIEKQVKYMLDHPECNYVATNMFQVGNDNAVDLDTAMKVDNLTYMKLIDENPIPGCTVMFKTDVAKTFQYNETKDADGIEDHGMWKQIVYAGHKMHFIDEPL